jgi:hypothetical protein
MRNLAQEVVEMGDKKECFVVDLVGTINATFKTLARQMGIDDAAEVARGINSGEWVVVRAKKFWREGDLICFEVTSHATTGAEWNQLYGFKIGEIARSLLLSPGFKPTSGVTTKVAVLPGTLFADANRTTENIRAEADGRDLAKIVINPEVACLILEKFSEEDLKEMGLGWIIAMHNPIMGSGGSPRILGVYRLDGGCRLGAFYDGPDGRWDRGIGFAFVVS